MRLDTKLVVHFLLIKYFWLIFCWHVQYSYIMCGITELHTWTATGIQSSSYKQLTFPHTHTHTHTSEICCCKALQKQQLFSHAVKLIHFWTDWGREAINAEKQSGRMSLNVSENARKHQKLNIIHFPLRCMKIINDKYYLYSTH
jgi:hypothetical protein